MLIVFGIEEGGVARALRKKLELSATTSGDILDLGAVEAYFVCQTFALPVRSSQENLIDL